MRKPLPPGTVISYHDIKVTIVEDKGEPTLLVKFDDDDVVEQWHWELDGFGEGKVVSMPEPTEEHVKKYRYKVTCKSGESWSTYFTDQVHKSERFCESLNLTTVDGRNIFIPIHNVLEIEDMGK